MTRVTRLATGITLVAGACARVSAPVAGPPPPPPPLSSAIGPRAPATGSPDDTGRSRPAPPPTPRAQLRTLIDSLVGQPRFHNAFWGILIVDSSGTDTLYAYNADKLLLPASNMKIVTAAVALTRLGPDYRFRTTFVAGGPIRRDTLHGDLVVIGHGDPTVSDHMAGDPLEPLRQVADSLAARGIRHITGRIESGGNAFPGSPLGFGWSWDDLVEGYGAGVGGLFFNEGRALVFVRGGARPGAPVHVLIKPLANYPAVHVRAVTAAPSRSGMAPALSTTYDPASGDVILDGTIAPGDTTTLEVAYRDPTRAYITALTRALRDRGITVATARQPIVVATSADTLFTVVSPPLRAILPPLLKPSQNQIAEILLRTLGLELTGVGAADSGARVVASQLARWGIDSTAFVVRDGSGLSRYDYLTAATIVRVLSVMQHDTAFATFYQALPIAGVDGTLDTRMRGTPAAGNVHAKTGSVDRARSLSGYVTTADHVPLIFSLLCNNWTVTSHDVALVQDTIAVHLASMTLHGP